MDVTLHDVETAAAGEYAVGGSGYIVERDEDSWLVAASGGLAGNGNTLYGSDATDDGSTWEGVGIADANDNFDGVDSDAPDDLTVAGGGGTVYHWNGS